MMRSILRWSSIVILFLAGLGLLFLTANPLDDVSAVRQRAGVMVRGRWFAEAELQAMLAELVASYRAGWLQRLWPAGIVAVAVALAARRIRWRGKTCTASWPAFGTWACSCCP